MSLGFHVMSLMSVMQVGLSGMSAAEFTLDAVGNNLANLNTDGYKQAFPRFATQMPATRSLGQPTSGSSAGTNPIQVGRGVQLAEFATDFSQGSLITTTNPLDVAIEGDGFFVLQTPDGGRAYTRNGQFRINGQQRLVTADGDFILGWGVDERGNVVEGQLVRLEIGSSEVQAADGSMAKLLGYSIAGDGRILGRYSDGISRTLGKIPLARFNNPGGLLGVGGNDFVEGLNSGAAEIVSAGHSRLGRIIGGARELSNTDIGENLIQLLLARNQFRANGQVVHTASELLESLMHLQRC
jgi:flagellar hook protein FlgE